MKSNNDEKREPAEEETTTKLDKNKQTITPIETDWETNNGKPDCIGLVLGEGKLSGNLWVKEDIAMHW